MFNILQLPPWQDRYAGGNGSMAVAIVLFTPIIWCSFSLFCSKSCQNLPFSWLHVYLMTMVRKHVDVKNRWGNIPKRYTNQSRRKALGIRLPFPLSNHLWTMKRYFARLNCWSTCESFSWYPRNAHSTEKEGVGEGGWRI